MGKVIEKKVNGTKKVNFKEFAVQMEIEGDPIKMDIRKDIGNFIYQTSPELGALDLARKIYYSEGEIEISLSEVSLITALIEKSHMTLPLRLALLNISK